MIVLDGVTKAFGSHVVLRDLSLTLGPGTVTAVLGPNGSGKTTLGRLVLGLETPSAGSITRPAGLRGSAVFQENRLVEHLTAVGNVRLVLPRSAPPPVEALRAVGLPPSSLRAPVRALSGGQRRRVALVRGLLAPAEVLLLDEPFTGLDAEAKVAVVAWVRDNLAHRATLLITHDPSEAAAFGASAVHLPAPSPDL